VLGVESVVEEFEPNGRFPHWISLNYLSGN
jgi:hypothetical protein